MTIFDDRASLYNSVALQRGYGRVHTRLCDLFGDVIPPLKAGVRILDFGMGTGLLSQEILKIQPRADITGFEPAPNMIRLARKALDPHCKIVRGKFTAAAGLPFAPDSFDVVTSAGVLEHLDTMCAATMAEFLRVLRPGGHFVSTYHTHDVPDHDVITGRDHCWELPSYSYSDNHMRLCVEQAGAKILYHEKINAYTDMIRTVRYGVIAALKPPGAH